MTTLGIVYDERFRRHDTGRGHPERAERLDAVDRGLQSAGVLESALRLSPVLADDESLHRAHAPTYVARIKDACKQAWPYIDTPDCPVCPDSWEVARLSAGAALQGAAAIARGDVQRAFVAARPPGHHAEFDRAMGFCFFNNAAVAARALHEVHGLRRVLIFDFDVHHGNGTQHIFEHDARVLYVSIHGHPRYLYPHTGFAEERGRGDGEGFTLNVPLKPGAGDSQFRKAFERRVAPEIQRYAPELLILSAGFDAHTDDPLGNLELTDDSYAWVTRRCIELADQICDGRVLSLMEGGYNLGVLERNVAAHVRLLAGVS